MNSILTATTSGDGVFLPDGTTGEINYIGIGTDTGQQALVGSIDEFRVWDGALQQSDITSHFLAGPDENLG
jgi:hypothetical protein